MANTAFSTANSDGSLILPRVNVEWGTVNLTCPTATGSKLDGIDLTGMGPLVYDIRMSMEDQGQTPSGSMKWSTTAQAYAVYEKCIELFREWSIMMTFYYVTGKSITFEFFWAGQSETYGKEMEITVKLVSFMDGLINANFYATIQADKEEKGKSYKDSLQELMKQFGLSGIPFREPFIRYTKQAEKDLSEATVKMSYNDGSTFMDAMQNLVKDNGNFVFFNNIGSANATVFGPFTYECEKLAEGEVLVRRPPLLPGSPDPTVRYAYVIGPNIIQSFTRTMEWQPPQKSQEISAILAKKKEKSKDKSGGKDSNPSSSQRTSSEASLAPSGVYGSKNTSNISSDKNTMGPIKQDMFTKEKTAKLAFTTLMCPSLVGIKPLDIVYIPSYSSDYLEDWVVNSVEYQQTQGGVDLAIQATRVYGSGEPMCVNSSNDIRSILQQIGLMVPPDSKKASYPTLEAWLSMSWKLYIGFDKKAPPAPPSTGPAQPGDVSTTQTTPEEQRSLEERFPLRPERLPTESVREFTDEEVLEIAKKEQAYVIDRARAFPNLEPDQALTVSEQLSDGTQVIITKDRSFAGWANETRAFGSGGVISAAGGIIAVPGVTLEKAQNTYRQWTTTGVTGSPPDNNTKDKYFIKWGREARVSGEFNKP